MAAYGLPLGGASLLSAHDQGLGIAILLSLLPALFILLAAPGRLRTSSAAHQSAWRSVFWKSVAFGGIGIELVLLTQVPVLLAPAALLLVLVQCPAPQAFFPTVGSNQQPLVLLDVLTAESVIWGTRHASLSVLAALAPTAPLFPLVLVWTAVRRLPGAIPARHRRAPGANTCSHVPAVRSERIHTTHLVDPERSSSHAHTGEAILADPDAPAHQKTLSYRGMEDL